MTYTKPRKLIEVKMRSPILGKVKIENLGRVNTNGLFKFAIETRTKIIYVDINTTSYSKALSEAEKGEAT